MFLLLHFITFVNYSLAFRITFKVGDVLPARIRACVARPGLAKCGGRKTHKGACADWVFLKPGRRVSAWSANRLLNDEKACLPFSSLFLNYFFHFFVQNASANTPERGFKLHQNDNVKYGNIF